jgi:hypothetical protein
MFSIDRLKPYRRYTGLLITLCVIPLSAVDKLNLDTPFITVFIGQMHLRSQFFKIPWYNHSMLIINDINKLIMVIVDDVIYSMIRRDHQSSLVFIYHLVSVTNNEHQ